MLSLILPLLTLTPTAQAGGIGFIGTGGVRGETVYFYDRSDNDQKYSISETIANMGTGIEVMLGDRDDPIQGHFRGYAMFETPEYDPANVTNLVAERDVDAAWREKWRSVGLATVGLQFKIIGDPDTFQVVAHADMGSGFLTLDHSEFLLIELGGGITKAVGRDLQFFASAVYAVRVDRGMVHGANVYSGLRYLFD